MAEKVHVVGGGLAGLTAAINLAEEGREVLVLEKEERHGGRPEFRPDGAASPFDLEALKAYTGIDITPAVRPMDLLVTVVFGERNEIRPEKDSQTYMVERGPRSTSLDTLLYEKARDAGVEFEWGFSIKSPSDVAQLPENSIVATGLDVQGFEAMGIPYVPFWGWFAKGNTEDRRTVGYAYIDDFTVDYAFTTLVNGTAFALLFQRRKPLLKEQKKKYEEYVKAEGIELQGYRDLIGGAAPHRYLDNPVLFKNNMIVVGTLAGVMEPMMNFGMLGAMICGKIGAIAVTDKGLAYEEFGRLVSFFSKSLMLKKVHDAAPAPARKALWGFAARMMERVPQQKRDGFMRFVPGYGGFDRRPG